MCGFGMSIAPGTGIAGKSWNGSSICVDLLLCTERQAHLQGQTVNRADAKQVLNNQKEVPKMGEPIYEYVSMTRTRNDTEVNEFSHDCHWVLPVAGGA